MATHKFYEHVEQRVTLADGTVEKTFGCLCGEIGDEDLVAMLIGEECEYHS